MRENRGRTRAAIALGLSVAMGVAACGGGETTKDATEASGDFPVEVTRATFEARQNVSGTSDLTLAVTNTGDEDIPQLAITIWTGKGGVADAKPQGSFNLAEPVWLQAPGYPKLLGDGVTAENADGAPSAGAVVAQTDTYGFGALPADESRTVVWRVTPVRAGDYTVHYAVSAGLKGGAKAVTAEGDPAVGAFDVKIDDAPRGSCVVEAGQPGRCE